MIFEFLQLGQYQARTDRHRLAGEVFVDGVHAARLIVVLDRATMTYIASTWSDPVTGLWEIKGLPQYPELSLLVLVLDNIASHNAEAADYVSQVTA